LGRRILKLTLNWTGPGWTLQNERRFLYDGWNPIAEYNTTTGYSLVSHYTWGIDLAGSLQDAGGVGGLLRVYSYETGSQVILMPAYDGNGNIYAMVDRSSGAMRAIYEYSAFGETLRASGDMAARNPFRFSTKYTDDETQLLYYGFRYYNPLLGRFLGRDPVSERGGLNLYGFVGNNGPNRWDLLGMCSMQTVSVWNEFAQEYHGATVCIEVDDFVAREDFSMFTRESTNWDPLDYIAAESDSLREGLREVDEYAAARRAENSARKSAEAVSGVLSGLSASFNSAISEATKATTKSNEPLDVTSGLAAGAPNRGGREYGGFDGQLETGGRNR
jgi:RHS repeat-associated protein